MPSIAAHMVCAKLVAQELNINDVEFIKGNIIADITSINDYHKREKVLFYNVPNLDYFYNHLNLKDNYDLGILCHMILDKLFCDDFLPPITKGQDVFYNGKIYKEYDVLSYKLIKKFNLDVTYLTNCLKDFKEPLDKEKYAYNIECLNNKDMPGTLEYLDLETFSNFLIDSSHKISKIIMEVK